MLAEREDEVDSSALGPTAREEEPHFWQVGGARSRRAARPLLFELAVELEEQLELHVASFSAETCVYKVMGAPKVLSATSTTSATSAPRPSRCSATTVTRPTPGRRSCACSRSRVLGHNGEINTIARLRSEARMLGVPIRDDSSDSQDLNRTIDTLIHRRGLSLPEAMELAVPPIVNEIRSSPRTSAASTCTCARRWARSRRARSR